MPVANPTDSELNATVLKIPAGPSQSKDFILNSAELEAKTLNSAEGAASEHGRLGSKPEPPY